ncbi:MAG: carbohydrate kinase [Gammaproteobacteria bacterium]|nr:carbohydrate kinase [Gammaproteobacteria bacterium]
MIIPNGDLDLLAVGEALVDFISEMPAKHLREVELFRRYQGGSAANVAVNVAKLGGAAAVVAKVGIGAFGTFIKSELRASGVNTDYLLMDHRVHTTVVFVARTTGTPDFEALRAGDAQLGPGDIPADAIRRSRIVYSTAFALSRQPERVAVQRAFALATEHGRLTSLDPNYSPIVWPQRNEALNVIRGLLTRTTFVKPSLDDCRRLFNDDVEPGLYVDRFHDMGASTVVLTMGADGVIASDGRRKFYVPARPVKVRDVTGAGDSFWGGFLVATLDGHDLERSVRFAGEVAARKLAAVGPLPGVIDRREIYASIG